MTATVGGAVVAPLHRHFSPKHLIEVIGEMLHLGAPVLRAYLDAPTGAWLAREGTHRLRAAFLLGWAPVLVPIPWWRTQAALERARFAAIEYGYAFPQVLVNAHG